MSIYSEDRTMLTVDPLAESKVMPGYETVSDLYEVLGECAIDDCIIYRAVIEAEMSCIMLDEADDARKSKYAQTMLKLAKATSVKLAKYIAKHKSISVGTKKRFASYYDKKIAKMIDKYQADFNRNKDIASSDRFQIKYDKKALMCTSKEFNTAVTKAGKSAQALAKSAVSIAKSNTKEIIDNRRDAYKVPAVAKYAKDFCCCEEAKSEIVNNNPYKNGLTPAKLAAELSKAASIDAALDKLSDGAVKALEDMNKSIENIGKVIEKNMDKSNSDDVETLIATIAISDAIAKGCAHALNDVVREYKKHLNECIKVYIATAKIKAIKEGSDIKYVADDSALCESDIMAQDLEVALEF